MTDEQRKELNEEINRYIASQNARITNCFKQMCAELERATEGPMIDPNTRQKVGHSDLDEVIL